MTVPVTGLTQNFGIEYIVEGEPARNTRAKLERNAKTIDAALTRGGVAPPNAQDLVAVAGRVTALEAVRPAMRRTLTGSPAIPSAVVTPIVLNAADYQNGNAAALLVAPVAGAAANTTSGIKVRDAGLYLLAAEVNFGSGGSAGFRTAIIRVNGVVKREIGAANATAVRLAGSVPLPLAAGDVVDLAVYASGAAGVTVVGIDSHDNGLSVVRL